MAHKLTSVILLLLFAILVVSVHSSNENELGFGSEEDTTDLNSTTPSTPLGNPFTPNRDGSDAALLYVYVPLGCMVCGFLLAACCLRLRQTRGHRQQQRHARPRIRETETVTEQEAAERNVNGAAGAVGGPPRPPHQTGFSFDRVNPFLRDTLDLSTPTNNSKTTVMKPLPIQYSVYRPATPGSSPRQDQASYNGI